MAHMDNNVFSSLSERQRIYLRLAHLHYSSHEIAFETESTYRAVDKQLAKACKIIGARSRFEAAREFVEFERGVESLYPEGRANLSFRSSIWSVLLPLPTEARPISTLSRHQAITWGVFIALLIPVGIAMAAMLIVTISLLLGVHLG